MKRDQMDYMRRRVREEDRAAARSMTLEARQAHAEMALLYRDRLRILESVLPPLAA